LISNSGDVVDYETIISEKFPNCDVEVLTPDVFELEQLVEYISDDIVVYNPHTIMVYRHMIRFLMNVGVRGKIYYLENFSDDDLKIVHEGLLKFTWKRDVKINLFKNSNPDRDVLGL
jgi:lipoate synthase